jgi:hypothetical protein
VVGEGSEQVAFMAWHAWHVAGGHESQWWAAPDAQFAGKL